ncbi:hypothetical protein QIH01_20040 [Brevibacillus brevis]|nr:hypothetical protein QIH01_20040 [Brevibacillus brevis]
MEINIRGTYKIKEGYYYNSNDLLSFTDKSRDIKITIDPDGARAIAYKTIQVTEDIIKCLQLGVYEILENKLIAEIIQQCDEEFIASIENVLALIKYCFNQLVVDDDLNYLGSFAWFKDGEWKFIPSSGKIYVRPVEGVLINPKNSIIIQNYLDSGFKPFIALKHLHRAKREKDPRFKWIDATISAELAIKEFLIKINPDIKLLLLELPSPPLYKLYGPILEQYAGEPSPKLKQIQKGIEIRNKLIHKPEDADISLDKASEYVHDIEIAIYHLLQLLYPEDLVVNLMYRTSLK